MPLSFSFPCSSKTSHGLLQGIFTKLLLCKAFYDNATQCLKWVRLPKTNIISYLGLLGRPNWPVTLKFSTFSHPWQPGCCSTEGSLANVTNCWKFNGIPLVLIAACCGFFKRSSLSTTTVARLSFLLCSLTALYVLFISKYLVHFSPHLILYDLKGFKQHLNEQPYTYFWSRPITIPD